MYTLSSPARSKQSTSSKVVSATALMLLFAGIFWSSMSSAKRLEAGSLFPQTPQEPAVQGHVLAASYYSLKDNLSATLMLNNKSPHAMDAHVTLFSITGEALALPAITVDGVSQRTVDLRDYAPANSQFTEGNLQLIYYGKPLQMGAQVRIVDAEHSLMSDEQLTYPVQYVSQRREAVWRLPSHTCDVRLILTNSSTERVTVQTNIESATPKQEEPIALMPYETRVINLREAYLGPKGRPLPELGGISIEHTGPQTALMGRILVQEPATGYSAVIELVDPRKAKSTKLQGGGLRWGSVGDDELTQDVVARNVGNSVTTLIGRIPYTRSDGTTGVASVPRITLPPGQTKAVNVAAALRAAHLGNQVATLGLEFEYEGEPGNVVMSAQSVGKKGNQVFRVPILDPAAQRSSTGGYPWIVDDNQDTVVYLKNTSDQPQHYVAHLKTAGVAYMIGQKLIDPGQTVKYDIRSLRDLQVPDENGNTIPLDATHGHFKWSVILEEDAPEQLVMIGRAEHFNIAQAMSSTYACASCCADSTVDSYLIPFFDVEVFADDVVDFDAVEVKEDCYGDQYHSVRLFGVSWSSSDGEVASVNSSGTVTTLNGGETDIQASFSGRYYYTQECYPQYGPEKGDATDEIQPNLPGCGGCSSYLNQQRPRGRVRVKPRITSITPNKGVAGAATGVTIDGRGFGSNPSVTISGTGVTYSGSSGSATQLTGSLTVAGTATGGNRTIQVSNKGQASNGVNFFVQVPSEFIPLGMGSANLGCASTAAGFGAEVSYQVADQSGQAIAVSGMTPQEHFTVNGNPAFSGFRAFATPPTTDANGRFLDTPIGTCFDPAPSSNLCVDVVQTFNIVVGTTTFSIPSVTTRRDCVQGMRVVVTTGTVSRSSSMGTVN